ncbi:hypothetical protein BGZ95_009907 [Linnemannia exigua]|uniref:Crinkler effector protein N-terminal domain-containing protein n=1 Tax=Linnemannia exigua TaxID=604196 RepID=A0AAD4H6A5_9FUNG|nr:hypothetical protein BGZ95_009907 [Linnemannia exigua]
MGNSVFPLFIVLNGRTFAESLHVNATSNQTVEDLKVLVRNAIPQYPAFSDLQSLEADKLTLWRAVLPHPRTDTKTTLAFVGAEIVWLDALRKKRKLLPGQILGDIFGGTNYFPVGGMMILVLEPEA